MTSKYIIDSRDLHKDLNIRYKHADWIKSFIKRLELVEDEDYITYREGKKHMYRFSETVLEKLDANAKGPQLTDIYLPEGEVPDGYIVINDEPYLPSNILATYLEKRHDNVLRDIEKEVQKLNLDLSSNLRAAPEYIAEVLKGFVKSTYKAGDGSNRKIYLLNIRAALQMAAKYSPVIRAKLIDVFLKYQANQFEALRQGIDNLSLRHVYILQGVSTGQYKIGVASKPEQRAASLSTSTEDVEVVWSSGHMPNPFKAEKSAHEAFKDYKTRREWFEDSLPVLDVIEYIKKEGGLPGQK